MLGCSQPALLVAPQDAKTRLVILVDHLEPAQDALRAARSRHRVRLVRATSYRWSASASGSVRICSSPLSKQDGQASPRVPASTSSNNNTFRLTAFNDLVSKRDARCTEQSIPTRSACPTGATWCWPPFLPTTQRGNVHVAPTRMANRITTGYRERAVLSEVDNGGIPSRGRKAPFVGCGHVCQSYYRPNSRPF